MYICIYARIFSSLSHKHAGAQIYDSHSFFGLAQAPRDGQDTPKTVRTIGTKVLVLGKARDGKIRDNFL